MQSFCCPKNEKADPIQESATIQRLIFKFFIIFFHRNQLNLELFQMKYFLLLHDPALEQ